eukprot:3490672-Pleurochrysis_carterae.AAC.1
MPPLATAQSDRAFRATRLEPRTPSCGVHQAVYILWDLPGATIREQGGELIISYNTKNQRSGSERERGGWALLRCGSESGALRQGRSWALRGLQNSESGAQALREYACDAIAI